MKRTGIIITIVLVVMQLCNILRAQPTAFTTAVQPLELVKSVVPEPVNMQAVLLEDKLQGGAHRFAVPRVVELTPLTDGRWEEIDEETLLWRLPITSPEAVSISLGFTCYFMPPGGKLFIYSVDESQVLGPFTENDNEEHGQLWTPLIYSDTIIVELTIPISEAPLLELELTSINHGYRNIDPQLLYREMGDSDWCHRNVACPEGDPWRDQIRSVARFHVTREGDGTYWSTGTLVNNTAQDYTPYFLTAFHSFDKKPKDRFLTESEKKSTATMVIYWNFEASTCEGTTGSDNQNQTGAILRAAHGLIDFALVELDDMPSQAFGVYYAGWDHTDTAPSSGVAIHHPNGDLKKISKENDPLNKVELVDYNPYIEYGTYFQVSGWDVGVTSTGSSGGPIFNSNKRIVGVLSRGASDCSNPGPDYFGTLYRAWTGGGTPDTRLSNWLDPFSTGILFMDGKNPPIEPSVDGVVFEDTFPSWSIDRTKWPVVDGATIYNAGYDASSPPYAVLMNGTPDGGDLIESKAINLSSFTYAILNYHYDKATMHDPPESGDELEPGPGDDLIISYLSNHGWVEIDRQLGFGSHMRNYRLVSIHLPTDALHSNFKIRIESIGDSAAGSEIYDNWFVDDVNVVGQGSTGSSGPVRIFEETFPTDNMNSPLWSLMYGVFVSSRAAGEPSAPFSLNLNGYPGNYDEVRSKKMDLSEYSRAVLSYRYAQTCGNESPDDGDDLIISYWNGWSWIELDRQLGSGPDMESFSAPVRLTLPASAMHDEFMFRIQSIGTASWYDVYDDWFVDDIIVEVWR